MKLPGRRYDEIIKSAVDMFVKHDIRSIPIKCFEIANKMSIRLMQYSRLTPKGLQAAMEQSEDGFAVKRLEGFEPFSTYQWYIFYNDQKTEERVRFTIMHELGHIVLDHTEASDLAEAEANFFAKYCLAPPPLVHEINPEDYIDIANRFNLSKECALYSMDYYNKWLRFGAKEYTPVEVELLALFEDAV